MLSEKLKLMHTAARRLSMLANGASLDDINKLETNHHVLNVSKLNNNKYFNDLKILFDNLNLMYDEIVQSKVKEEELLGKLKLHKKQINQACTQLIKLNHSAITLFLSEDEKKRQALFEKNCQKLITTMAIIVHECEKNTTKTTAPTQSTTASASKQEAFDLELNPSSLLSDAKTKFTTQLQLLSLTINNLKLNDINDPKIRLLEVYHSQMAKVDNSNIENIDIATLQLKRVNFKLKSSSNEDATIKDENLIHAKASTRPILGAILMTSAVLLGLTSIALFATVKLAPIGLVGLALSLKLLTAGAAMVGLSLSVGSLYFFMAKEDLTNKTTTTLKKLDRVIALQQFMA